MMRAAVWCYRHVNSLAVCTAVSCHLFGKFGVPHLQRALLGRVALAGDVGPEGAVEHHPAAHQHDDRPDRPAGSGEERRDLNAAPQGKDTVTIDGSL